MSRLVICAVGVALLALAGCGDDEAGKGDRGVGAGQSRNITVLTDDTFDAEVMQASTPVLIDFWAEWCGPCKMVAPTVDRIADDYAGRLKVGKVDVDVARETAKKHQITAIPTLIIFKGGNVSEQITGAVAKSQISAAIDKAVA